MDVISAARAGWLIAALAVAVAASIAFYHVPIGSAGFFAYAGHAILEGQLPYRDVWDNKLPSIYYLNALLQLAGPQNVLQWAAQAAVLLATIALFAIFARGEGIRAWGPATLTVSVLLSLPPLQHFGYTEPYAAALIMAALVAMQRGATLASGTLLLLAATFWIPAALMTLALLVYAPTVRARLRFAGAFGASAAVYAALFVVTFGTHLTAALLHDMRSYEGTASRLDAASAKAVVAKLVRNLEATALLIPLALAAGVVHRPANRTQRFALAWLACALAGAFVNLNVFQHYFIPSVAPLAFAIAAFVDGSGRSLGRRAALAALIVAITAGVPVIVAAMLDGIAAERDEARLTVAVGQRLDAALPKRGRILVYGTADGIYRSANRDAVGRFANTFALTLTSADLQRRRRRAYLDDVRRADALVSTMPPSADLEALLRTAFAPPCSIDGARIAIGRHVRLANVTPDIHEDVCGTIATVRSGRASRRAGRPGL